MYQEKEEVQLTKIESVFVFGIIGCMLFATWELGHLMADEWFHNWVEVDSFVRRRLILYGIAFIMSIASVLFTIKYADNSRRFVQTINRAFLWYGTLLLISTIAIFVFDCLPEVFAGFIGAGVFIGAIYIIQKKYFTRERSIAKSIERGKCFSCGSALLPNAMHCSQCNEKVGQECDSCGAYTRINDKFCSQCGKAMNRG